jgi:two-component system response regulator YesN
MQIFSNVLAPLISGVFFLIYFIYFAIANPSKAASYRFFVVILVSLSAFSLGRPLQLLLGPHPIPLIIVNLRVFLLCAVIAPAILLASDLFNKKRRRGFERATIAAGALLGTVYVVFNTLGTRASRELFDVFGGVARDNLTPSLQPPFYGREVTIGVQVVTGLLLVSASLVKLARLKLETATDGILRNKAFLFNLGVLIFAVSFIVGSLAKQWGIYYSASMLSALLFGGSVLMDVKEVHVYYERLVPFIKEDIVDDVAFGGASGTKAQEMLDCLGKASLNTFAIVKIKESGSELREGLKSMDGAMEAAARRMAEAYGEERCLVLPLSQAKIGIAFRPAEAAPQARKAGILEVFEDLQADLRKGIPRDMAIGIGRTYPGSEGLRASYREALSAQEYAERFESTSVVHADDLDRPEGSAPDYPAREKEKVLSCVKLGDAENALKALEEFLVRFGPYVTQRPAVLKVRLYDFVGSVVDSAILGGGDEKRLNEMASGYFADIEHAKGADSHGEWMAKVVSETAAVVVRIHEKRSKSIIKNALAYIDGHYASPLSYKDVAQQVFISPSYFLCLLKQETGQTFVDHLTAVRVERAKALLSQTDKPIAEIAYEVGFANSDYFSRIFRKATGKTAKEYREKK